jgi:proton-dependent oligopeptide transporter, POT family
MAAADPTSDLFGHPRGLAVLFCTEMWERFSYYGMRALLVLFMVDRVEHGGLGFSDQTATAIYGLYTAAGYLVSLPGGWIADKLWGAQRSVFVGGFVIMCGHFVLAVPSVAGFFLGLLLVVLGTGLLKPNASAVVGDLYAPGDARRDSGFTLFYMGINVGAFLGPLLCGWLAQLDWHYGFAAAGVGMLAGLVQFRWMRGWLGTAGNAPLVAPTAKLRFRAWVTIAAAIGAVLLLFGLALRGAVELDALTLAWGTVSVITAVALVYFGALLAVGKLSAEERRRVVVILILVFASAIFWAGYEQAGSALNLFAQRHTVRDFAGFEIPATWFQSLNPVFIILLAPAYSALWVRLARRHLEPATPAKFGVGLMILGAGFAVMVGAATLVAGGNQAGPSWLVATYLLHTMGEMALSPVGLSAMTKLAPRRWAGQMMGMWFMCMGLGNVGAGLIAGTFDPAAVGAWPAQYGKIALATAGTGAALLLFSAPLRRLMGGVR